MRGDPEYDDAVDLLYRKEKKKAQQKLRAVRVIVILLGIVSILVLFTLDYRPFRVAALPFVLGRLILIAVF